MVAGDGRPVFLVGFQRSGTTMLRLMLNAHPEIAIPHDSAELWLDYRRRLPRYNDLRTAADVTAMIRDLLAEPRIRAWETPLTEAELLAHPVPATFPEVMARFHEAYACRHGKRRWGDKNTGTLTELDQLNQMFPGCQFVHIVRDGRDCALSHRSEEYVYGYENVLRVAREWREQVGLCHKMGAMLPRDRFYELRYEDLVQAPESELRRLCAFLGLAFSAAMLSYHRTVARHVPANRRGLWPLLERPPVSANAFKWKSAMSPADRAVFDRVAGGLLGELGYEVLPCPVRGARGRELWYEVHSRLIWRVRQMKRRTGRLASQGRPGRGPDASTAAVGTAPSWRLQAPTIGGGQLGTRHWTLARLTLRDALGYRRPAVDVRGHLDATMAWLCRAHDAGGGGGVARSYALRFKHAHRRRGWLSAYPETTGYIIPTFLRYAAFSGDIGYRDRALRMARWEVEVQMECGAVQGGVIDFPPTPAVFNTGQVLFGWAAAFVATGDEQFRKAAGRAADFLVEAQAPDGAWRRGGSRYARPGVNVYAARTAWGLLEAAGVTGDLRHREAAVRNLEFALTRQRANGWFEECCLEDDRRPLLHTLAYATEGLLEAGVILAEPRYVDAARRTADALLARQRADGGLAGRFDAAWRPIGRWSCLTADAQCAVVWLRLFQLTGVERYRAAARRANRYLTATQDLAATDPGVRGGVQGSIPIWAEYAPYEYPSWAAKFLADALLLELTLARPERGR